MQAATLAGRVLTGGIKQSTSESPWAMGAGGMRYGMNGDGELVIRDPNDNETFVANFNTDTSGKARTAGVLVGELEIKGYRLMEAPKGFFYDTYQTLFGSVQQMAA